MDLKHDCPFIKSNRNLVNTDVEYRYWLIILWFIV